MDIIGKLAGILHRTTGRFDVVAPIKGGYRPQMVQRPLIDAGNTGRYALDAFQIPFNSPTTGTLVAGTFGHTGIGSIDVTTQQAVTLSGMGTIPTTPTTQGLVQGFRQNTV